MARTVVQLETKSADLASDFGLEWATKLFGAEAISSLEIRKSGKNKGAPKGFVIWRKALNSGWMPGPGPVKAGGLVDAWIGVGCLSGRDQAVCGQWLGRKQPLAATASAGYFFENGRAKHEREQARIAADRAAELAEYRAGLAE